MKPWECLEPKEKRDAWRARDPRVPEGWVPPGMRTWEQASNHRRSVWFRQKDPRVPLGWKPETLSRNAWDALSENRRRVLFNEGDPRVPPGWRPKVGRYAGFRQVRHPRQIVVPLSPELLALPEQMLWDFLETQWDALYISPHEVAFRVKDTVILTVSNPRFKTELPIGWDPRVANWTRNPR